MSPSLCGPRVGWCHDGKVWYFPDQTRPDGQIGETVTLRLVNQVPGQRYQTELIEKEVDGVISARREYGFGYYLNCVVFDEAGERCTAEICVATTPSVCDCVKFIPEVNT